ncbi:MAG: type II secretion system GspH family protein [Dehalococcoidales bacterium]|jgi:prepilin-type N-terminal cleavage/methylation domain-containing protein|nr:type II secretion system GspH family protein [Dehalococcoidales bacterium]
MIKRLRKQRGFGLVEVIIALGLLGVIGIAFLGALATASNAIIVSDERATAESLSRSEMEYVKSHHYSIAPWSYELPLPPGWPEESLPDWWDTEAPHTLPPGYENYTATVVANRLDPQGDGAGNDDGLQKITITITFLADTPEEKLVITLEGYKTG